MQHIPLFHDLTRVDNAHKIKCTSFNESIQISVPVYNQIKDNFPCDTVDDYN